MFKLLKLFNTEKKTGLEKKYVTLTPTFQEYM